MKYNEQGAKVMEFDSNAGDIPYDGDSVGIDATNVQDAIDEVVSFASVYAGYCTGSAGASVAITTNPLATGWTVSQQATGRFRVTHNLNLSNAKYLAVVANVTLNAGSTDDRYCTITNENVNYFEVLVNDVGAGAVNDNFYFHAVRLAA